MSSFLPFVKPEIGFSLEREICDKFDVEYVKNQLEKLKKDNPSIAEFIMKFSKKTGDSLGTAFCGVMVYRMLESQSEANSMLSDDFYMENLDKDMWEFKF